MGMEQVAAAAAGALSDDPQLQDDAGTVEWETVANANFDDVVAKIMCVFLYLEVSMLNRDARGC